MKQLVTFKKVGRERGHALKELEAKTGIKYSRINGLENIKEHIWKGDVMRLEKVLSFPEGGIVDENGMAKLEE